MSNWAVHPGLIALLFFFVFFIGVVVWIYRPGSRAHYQKMAELPLDKDTAS